MLALRKQAGLTQVELAEAVGVTQGAITFWEWSEHPPRSKELPVLAQALGVEVPDLIASEEPERVLAKRSGPVGELQKVFEEVRKLPRRQQRKIIEIVSAMVEQHKRKSA